NMKDITNIQPTVHTDIRNTKQQSRIRMALAGSGIAGAMLLGGLFGTHAVQPAAQHQAHIVKTNAIVRSGVAVTQMKTIPMSYTMANDYVSMARQAAID